MAQLKDKFPVEYDEIRQSIVELLEEKFQSNNPDLYESGFLAYFSDALSTLTLDSLFYSSMSYKEAFLTQAVLPESVINIARQLSYVTPNAAPSSADIMLSVPYSQRGVRLWTKLKFEFQPGMRFTAGSIIYLLPYSVFFDFDYTDLVNFKNDLYQETDTNISKIPYTFTTIQPDTNDPAYTETYLQFQITCQQYITKDYSFKAPRIDPLRFYSIDVPYSDQVYKVEVFVKEDLDADYLQWTGYDNVFELSYGETGYAATIFTDKITVSFGNGIYGRLPRPNADIKVTVYETKGREGKVVAGSITSSERVYDDYSGNVVTMYITNPTVSTDGIDRESIEQTRKNAKDFARAVNGLVSEKNYQNLTAVLKMPLQDSLAIIKRSDVHSNEIFTYIVTKFTNTQLVPTRSSTVTFHNNVLQPIAFDGISYVCPFEITLDTGTHQLMYKYVTQRFTGPVELSSTTSAAQNYAVVLNDYRIIYDSVTRTFALQSFYDYVAKDQFGNEDPTFATKLSLTVHSGTHTYSASNDTGNSVFTATIPRSDISDGQTSFTFTLFHQASQLKTYKTTLILSQDLSALIASPTEDLGGGNVAAYDVPLIEKNFYIVNQEWVDINVLQDMANFVDTVIKYRMMTDQVYLKFANTIGKISNIKYNSRNPQAVKTYANPNFFIPITVSLKVYVKAENSGLVSVIANNVKSTLYNYYNNLSTGATKFGFEVNIYQSEIAKVVQSVDKVEFCEVLEPTDSIVYDYSRTDLTKQEMIEFTPEYIWFSEDNIHVQIVID